jgi:hypothetical protein
MARRFYLPEDKPWLWFYWAQLGAGAIALGLWQKSIGITVFSFLIPWSAAISLRWPFWIVCIAAGFWAESIWPALAAYCFSDFITQHLHLAEKLGRFVANHPDFSGQQKQIGDG